MNRVSTGQRTIHPSRDGKQRNRNKPSSSFGMKNDSFSAPWINEMIFDTMADDVQLHILSFLSVSEGRGMALVSKYYRRLLHSQEAIKLWTEWLQQQWPSPDVRGRVSGFVDLFQLSATLVDSPVVPSLSRLFGMASRQNPTSIDESHLQRPPSIQSVEEEDAAFEAPTLFRTLKVDGRSATQFLGSVGTGARSIRTNEPLARPECVQKSKSSFSPIGRRSKWPCSWKPFVAPYMMASSDDSKVLQVNLTPRFVSYYEVSILACPNESPLDNSNSEELNDQITQAEDCVAVGVATDSFNLDTDFPGWDVKGHSFAIHGDDGGIFHSSGNITRQFGRPFGEGDTVGCGVDYVKGGIFFTRNGEFLGYAWTGLDKKLLGQDLFPTIGVDSSCPLVCNFGERPFEFDLSSIVKQHKELVKVCCGVGTPSKLSSLDSTRGSRQLRSKSPRTKLSLPKLRPRR